MMLAIVGPLLLMGEGRCAPLTEVDGSGASLTLPAPAQRVVSLAPHITELLFAVGAGGQVVGVSSYSDFPPEAAALPVVGGYHRLDLERIVALAPHLVVGWAGGNPPAQMTRLAELGVPVYRTHAATPPDIAMELERLGRLTGHPEEGARAAERLRSGLAALAARYRSRPPVRVFYQVWHAPLISVGRGSMIHQVIRLCGGENVFGGLPDQAPRVSLEAVLAADPQVIVASGMDAARPEWLDQWRQWPQLAAVAAGQLHFVEPDLIQRQGPRLLAGATALCQALEQARSGPSAPAAGAPPGDAPASPLP